jgi:glycosyltransferase involved in cell wall biosynthesis
MEESKVRADVWLFNHIGNHKTFWIMPDTSLNTVCFSEFNDRSAWLIPKVRPSGITELFKDYIAHLRCIQQAVKQAVGQIGSIDMIQVRDDPVMAYVGWRLSGELKIPFIYQVSHLKEEEYILYSKLKIYGPPWINYLKGRVGMTFRNWLLRKADLIFPISEQMRETLIQYGLPIARMIVLPTGVNVSLDPSQYDKQAQRIRKNLGLEGKKIIIYSGTMGRLRELDFLLYVLKRLLSLKDVHLLMVGGGRDREDLPWLQGKALELGVEGHVTFTGRVAGEEVAAYIRAADIGLSPFAPNPVLINNAPIKILEYINMEIPVVASDIPDQKKVLEESGAGYCVNHNEEAFADAVLRLLKLPEEEQKKMGRAGYQYVKETRDIPILCKIVEKAYLQLKVGVKV